MKKHYAAIIRELSWGDFKLKYYGSVFGLLWSFLKPVIMLSILYVVFYSFLKITIEHYAWYLLIGIIFWNFFADATKDSIQNMYAKAHILKNTNTPPIVVMVSSIVHSLFTFLITLVAFFAIISMFGFAPSNALFFFPCIVLLAVLLTFAVSLIIVPLSVRFKDFEHMWDIFLQMLFWVTPIVYQHYAVPAAYVKWYLLNPLARIIIDARTVILAGAFPETKQILITIGIVLFLCAAAVFIFKRSDKSLVEQL